MSENYDKFADPIPLSNAKAQVVFWQMDYASSLKYLHKVKTYEKYGLKFYDKFLAIAQKDLEDSKRGLAAAVKKYQEMLSK